MYTLNTLMVLFVSLTPLSLANASTLRFTRLQTSDVDGPLVHARQSSGVEALSADINTISKNLASANATVLSFEGGGLKGIVGLTKINSAVVDLGNALTTTTETASSTPKLNVVDSTTIGVQFLNVQPNINTLLNNLAAKRPDLDGAAFGLLDVRSLIRDSLSIQQDGASALGTSLIAALDPSLAGIAQPINTQIQGNFTAAVNQFSGRSGVIKIPTKLVPAVSDLLDSVSSALGITNNQKDVTTASAVVDAKADSGYCCGITQADIDQLGTEESDYSRVPLPVKAVLRKFGMDETSINGQTKAVEAEQQSSDPSDSSTTTPGSNTNTVAPQQQIQSERVASAAAASPRMRMTRWSWLLRARRTR